MKSEAKTILINNAKKTSKLPAAISSIRLFPHNIDIEKVYMSGNWEEKLCEKIDNQK